MHSIGKAKTKHNYTNRFSLDPLPYYRDTPRSLKSLEVARMESAQTFSPETTQTYTRDNFISCMQGFLTEAGIDDEGGHVLKSVMAKSEHDGVYKTPDPVLLEGIKIGWYSKPHAPMVSAAFEQSQIDFQSEIMRLIREHEERVTRMMNTQITATSREQDHITLTIPKSEQLSNLKKRNFKIMLWTICFVYNMGTIRDIVSSPGWNTAIKFWIKKGWVTWSENVTAKHGFSREAADSVASKTRKTFINTPPFKDGTLVCPPVASKYYYATNSELDKDIATVVGLLSNTEASTSA